jgi:hypothetical protein
MPTHHPRLGPLWVSVLAAALAVLFVVVAGGFLLYREAAPRLGRASAVSFALVAILPAVFAQRSGGVRVQRYPRIGVD